MQMAVDQKASQSGLATSDELSQYFGSPEIASTVQNAYATQLEDQLTQLVPYTQQLEQTVQQQESLLMDVDRLSEYYLKLEQIETEYGNPNPLLVAEYEQQQLAQQPAQPQGRGFTGIPQIDQQLAAGMGAGAGNANPLLSAANAAAQYTQNAMTGQMPQAAPQQMQPQQPQQAQRPAFPQLPVANGQSPSFSQVMSQIPPSEWYKAIDSMREQGMFRGSQLAF
jgi:hypothetical protein